MTLYHFRPSPLIVSLFALVCVANAALEFGYGVKDTVCLKPYPVFRTYFLVAFHTCALFPFSCLQCLNKGLVVALIAQLLNLRKIF